MSLKRELFLRLGNYLEKAGELCPNKFRKSPQHVTIISINLCYNLAITGRMEMSI
jgi:hypothetical protein